MPGALSSVTAAAPFGGREDLARLSQIRAPPPWVGEAAKSRPPPAADVDCKNQGSSGPSSPEQFGEGGSGDESGREGSAQPETSRTDSEHFS